MITDNRRKWVATLLILLGAFSLSRLCFLILPNIFEVWNAQTIDRLFALRTSLPRFRPAYDHTVVHVDLSNSTIQRLDNLYLSRSHFARVVRNLAAMRVHAQVYDFLFASRLRAREDRELIEAASNAGNAFFGMALELREREIPDQGEPIPKESREYLARTKWRLRIDGDPGALFAGIRPLITFPGLARVSRGLGSLSVRFDRDGVLRRIPLLVRYGDGFYPSLSLRVVCDFLGVPPERILVQQGRQILLKGARRPGERSSRDIAIPIDRHGNMIVNFIGPWGAMDHYNFADVFLASDDPEEMALWREELAGKIVVISDVSTGVADVGPVPTDAHYPLGGVHSNAMNTILTGSFLRELAGSEMLLLEMLLLAVILGATMRFASASSFISVSLAAAIGYAAFAVFSFLYLHWVLNIVRPLLMVVLGVVSLGIYRYIQEEREKMESLRQRDFVRNTFGRYLSNEVVEELLGSPEGLRMSGELREVTLLVSDLRGFTALSAELHPGQIIGILNRYLERMVEIIAGYRGTINEFEGDGILAFFGAPLAGEDDPERAVACAIEMQNAMQGINGELTKQGLPQLSMGIGINTGEVVVGNIGSERRAKYSAIGNAINVAYRIESYTTGGQILISQATYEKVRGSVEAHGVLTAQFKGIDQATVLYEVTGIQGRYRLSLQDRAADELMDLAVPMPIHCFPLEGKAVSTRRIEGFIDRLGASSAAAKLREQVRANSSVKIDILAGESSSPPVCYAKVVPVDTSDPGDAFFQVRLTFTWLSQSAREVLESAREDAEK